MLKSILTILLSLLLSSTYAASTYESGIKAYQKNEFSNANGFFLKVISEETDNVSAYYNLGLSAYQDKKLGLSLWAFEKAYKLKPNDIQIVEMRMKIRSDLKLDTESNKLSKLDTIFCSVSSDAWAILACVFSFSILILLFLHFRSKYFISKSIGNTATLLLLILAFVCLYGAHTSSNFRKESGAAIVQEFLSATDPKNINHLDISEGTTGKIVNETKADVTLITDKGLRLILPRTILRTY